MSAPRQLVQRGICRARVRASCALAPLLMTGPSRDVVIAVNLASRTLAYSTASQERAGTGRRIDLHVPRRHQKKIDKGHMNAVTRSQGGPTQYSDLLSAELANRLQEAFPHVEQPTQNHLDFMNALWDDLDVFLKDRTGSGKTFALVLAIMSRCLAPSSNTPSPSHLFLLPSSTLVEQVQQWITQLQPKGQAPLALALSADKTIEADAVIPPILLATPNLLLPHLQSPDSPFSAKALLDTLQMVAIDEVDALLRPIPGRYTPASAAQHPFYLHPPAAVQALRPLLDHDAAWRKGRKGGRTPIQTVWMSASLNVPVKNWIFHQGWVGRGLRQLASLDGTAQVGQKAFAVPKEQMTGPVKHHLIIVDGLTGKLWDATQPAVASSLPTAASSSQPEAPGRTHPLLVEALASLWASSESSVSVVVPPEGSSTPKLLESLAALGVQAVVHGDAPAPAEAGNILYIVSRSQVRGLDLPTLDTVYVLGGLDASYMSKNTRQHGGMAEKEKEYRHILGRVGRMGRKEGEAEQKVVCLVMRNSPEHRIFEEYVAASKDKVVLDAWQGQLL